MALDRAFSVEYRHRLRPTRQALDPANPCLADLLEGGRWLAFVDQGLLACQSDLDQRIRGYAGGPVDLVEVPGGEAAKNDLALYEQLCRRIDRAGLCRHSSVVVWGGGAVLDVVGFAAATVHRGVRLIRCPSTTLAQGDAAVGVKNGINAFGKKNLLGTFSVPRGVVLDSALLATLPDPHWIAGFAEVAKVALLRSPELFEQLEREADRVRSRQLESAWPLLLRSAELHLEQIAGGGDPFEQGSQRPLDFGHWVAHRLEVLTDFRLTHGQAVAVGMAVDLAYGARVGLTPPALVERTLALLQRLGLPTWHPALSLEALRPGLEDFRQHLGGALCLSMIADLGSEVQLDRFNFDLLADCLAVAA